MAAFGDAGHAFPAIALARELKRRGHEVLVETWEEWQQAVEGEGLRFEAAQQYEVFPPPGPDTPQGQIVARAARALGGLMEDFEPDLVVSDILTRAPTLAAEVAGVPGATLIPHVYPVQRPGQPMYSMGFQPARTPLGRAGWRATMPLLNLGLRQGRDELNETRERLGLAPAGALPRGHQRAAGDRGDAAAARVPARMAALRPGRRGRSSSSCPPTASRSPRGTGRWS